jgi:hypothetical protein
MNNLAGVYIMLGHKKSLGNAMLGHKMPLGKTMLGHKAPMEHLAKLAAVTQQLGEKKKSGGLERAKRGAGWNSLGGYAGG